MPRPRELPVFFIDHCLGTEKVAERLRQEGFEARILIEEGFGEVAEDVEWLPVVAARGWAVLTKDKRIRRRAIEHDALIAAGVGAFVLAAGGMGGDAIAEAFGRALPKMVRLWQTRSRPFIATVTAQGTLNLMEGGGRRGGVKRG
jgi:hypothetical protein